VSVHLDRKEAIAILRELAAEDLVDPSYLHITERIPSHYQIQIKCNYRRDEIVEFAKKNQLTIKEDKEQKYLVIYKV
jgi:hypothetical protein